MSNSNVTRGQEDARPSPPCPQCGLPMRIRTGSYGTFYGCQQYPSCRGTREYSGPPVTSPDPTRTSRFAAISSANIASISKPLVRTFPTPKPLNQPQFEPIERITGSFEQEAIWHELINGNTHLVVEALAGTGKSTTALQACIRLPLSLNLGLVAFNRHIAKDLQGKVAATRMRNVTALTYHSLGLRAVSKRFPGLGDPDPHKLHDIAHAQPQSVTSKEEWSTVCSLAVRLTALAKNYLIMPTDEDFENRLKDLSTQHSVELNGLGNKALEMVPTLLYEDIKQADHTIDFDDMIWLPVVLNLPITTTFDILFIDEYQDSNKTQQELALRACPTGRLIIIGDRHQSLYGFRGADVTAMQDATKRLMLTDRRVKVFPLTVSRRCPISHVQLAQAIVPEFRHLDDAPKGEILEMPEPEAIKLMQHGDMVICRINAPLVPTAYALIKRNLKPIIRGREIGKGLLDLIDKLELVARDLPELSKALAEYQDTEIKKLSALGPRATNRISALRDKCDCLYEFIHESDSISNLKTRIGKIFSDFEKDGTPRDAIVLSSVHRAKGLEAARVFILTPELIPFPNAKLDWEQVQESNLAYVAVTRAKFDAKTDTPGTLVFCGRKPSIFESRTYDT